MHPQLYQCSFVDRSWTISDLEVKASRNVYRRSTSCWYASRSVALSSASQRASLCSLKWTSYRTTWHHISLQPTRPKWWNSPSGHYQHQGRGCERFVEKLTITVGSSKSSLFMGRSVPTQWRRFLVRSKTSRCARILRFATAANCQSFSSASFRLNKRCSCGGFYLWLGIGQYLHAKAWGHVHPACFVVY